VSGAMRQLTSEKSMTKIAGAARGEIFKITIHLPPLMPDHMLCGNDRSRRSVGAI
jgi:hypothetical protein